VNECGAHYCPCGWPQSAVDVLAMAVWMIDFDANDRAVMRDLAKQLEEST
jgi:hypothetical protein